MLSSLQSVGNAFVDILCHLGPAAVPPLDYQWQPRGRPSPSRQQCRAQHADDWDVAAANAPN